MHRKKPEQKRGNYWQKYKKNSNYSSCKKLKSKDKSIKYKRNAVESKMVYL